MKGVVIVLVVLILAALPWSINAYKFSRCDFEPNYKCEAIHGAGVFVPPLSLLTMWFGSDE